ncbi:hypothetical protein Y032_0070g418 [Ancylostoma ceylanicum]|uniref:Uncharacterized protein n=2 Tax=Ancylostoma ceylanicum TaxID=53326 RepID=A0A016TXR0_9BILA|nr:hypothetical protein Y032_0070g418 [Ancylostoma ceylanicum]
MKPSSQEMDHRIVVLLLPLLLPTTEANQRSSVQCADYLRCRNDELEERWKCNDATRRVVSDVCRVERHLRSIKRLTLRRESDFAVCVSKASMELDASGVVSLVASCSSGLPEPHSLNASQCEFAQNASNSRCAALRRCCGAATICENRSQYAALSSTLSMQRSAAEMLLRACRSDMDAVLAANVSKSDQTMAMTAIHAASAILKLIAEQPASSPSSSDSSRKNPQILLAKRLPTNVMILAPKVGRGDAPATPLEELPLDSSLFSRVNAEAHKATELAADPNSYRSRARASAKPSLNNTVTLSSRPRLYGARTKHFYTFGLPSRHSSLIRTVDSNTMKAVKHLTQEGTASVMRSIKSRSRGPIFSGTGQLFTRGEGRSNELLPHYVGLIIERRTPQPVDVIIDRSSQIPFASNIRTSYNEQTQLPTVVLREADSGVSTLPPAVTFPSPFTPSPEPVIPLLSPTSQMITTIRKPWSSRFKRIKHGKRVWRGNSLPKPLGLNEGHKSQKKHGMLKLWRNPPIRSIQPIDSFKDFSSKFPNNTDELTDIAVPIQNRLRSRLRFEQPLEQHNQGMMILSQNVTKLTNAQRPKHVYTSQQRKFFKTPEDAIYEDILEQERKVLIARNILPQPEDFDDPWSQRQPSNELSPPPPPPSNRDSLAFPSKSEHSLETVILPKRKTRKRMRKLRIKGEFRTTPAPTTSTRADPSLLTFTDDPLDGPIVETPLSNTESAKVTVRKEELEQIVDGRHEALVVFENVATSEPLRPKLTWSAEPTKPTEDSLFGPSFSTVPLPTEDDFITTSPDAVESNTVSEATSSSLGSTARPIRPKLLESVDQTATIIPTLKHAEWTAPPSDDSFRVEIIPFPDMNTSVNDGPLVVVDKQSNSAESREVLGGGAETTTPSRTTKTPLLVDENWVVSSPERMRVMGTKIEERDPVQMLTTDEKSPIDDSQSKAFSVLKLPETAVDLETKNLEETYGNCIKSRLGASITEVEATKCAAHSLPPSLSSEPCRSKLHVIKNHCSKLARCCTDAEVCRKEVDRSEPARLLRRKKESLALAAAKCQIQSYKDYRKRIKRKRELLTRQ